MESTWVKMEYHIVKETIKNNLVLSAPIATGLLAEKFYRYVLLLYVCTSPVLTYLKEIGFFHFIYFVVIISLTTRPPSSKE